MMIKIAPYIVTFAVGFALAFLFFKPKTVRSVEVVTNVKVDTVYNARTDTVFVPWYILEERIDTVYYSEPYEADVTVYSGRDTLDYGYIDWRSETTGKLINFSMIPTLTLPTITKEIETVRTITETRDLRGLYAGAGISQNVEYKLGASYVDRDWQFNYDYQPREKIHWVGVKKRLF